MSKCTLDLRHLGVAGIVVGIRRVHKQDGSSDHTCHIPGLYLMSLLVFGTMGR